ncbi:SDR family NAD(P)-dependent oxidoreductase [Hymenobacter sp. H14-R3]|uniref:SDR family NAD(P)-dependent oxidoreductase n=1 Tax=Hymenobacter sp. H14-R3 TaxID=3046308 RepID=UPI0024B965E7|nr:SDR family NAD(P)-dependent oxidoreductase [Hymenobacter sp. H14-R3]MDJ0363766.1 SDR family NAD(P)-dependent oxidoreductase [Hymenobacter sp. H14-R3]
MTPLQDKIILVTGATSGIGEVTARELARQGAHVILLARNREKAERTQREIIATTNNPLIDIAMADLSVLQEVRDVAAQLHDKYPRIDVLVNNAGLMFGAEREVSADGNEMTLATNHLGPFLLTSLLLDLLQKSPAARIVNVASMAYKFSKPTLDDIQSARSYSPMWEYGTSKLWNIMFTQELARRLRAHGITNVTTNSLHPGAVATGYGQQSGGWLSAVLALGRPFMLSPEKGAETSIFLASDPSVAAISGGYYSKKKPEPVKSSFNTLANSQRLWAMSEELTDTKFLD